MFLSQVDADPSSIVNSCEQLFLDVLFLDVLFLDVLTLDMFFLDVLFLDVLLLDMLFLDMFFLDVLFLDMFFLDVLFLDVLFLDVLFLDVLFWMCSFWMCSLWMCCFWMCCVLVGNELSLTLRLKTENSPCRKCHSRLDHALSCAQQLSCDIMCMQSLMSCSSACRQRRNTQIGAHTGAEQPCTVLGFSFN